MISNRILSSFSLVGLLLALWAAPVAAQPAVESTGSSYAATLTKTFDAEPGGTVSVRTYGGSLEVEGWDENTIEVTERIRMRGYSRSDAEEYVRTKSTSYEMTSSGLDVEGPRDTYRTTHNFTLRVPQRYTADLRTSGGSIRISNIEGTASGRTSGGSIDVEQIVGRVDIRTSGGSLSIEDVQGDVEGATSGGSIDVKTVSGVVDVRTSGGSIRVEDAQQSVDVKTAGGSIEIRRAGGAVEGATSGGDIRVEDAAADVDVKTAGGDIELKRIAKGVDAQTSGGDIEGSDLGGFVQARTSAGDIDLEGLKGAFDLRTSVGDVSISITASSLSEASNIETSHGDIDVQMPESLGVTVDAEVESYYGRVDRDDIYSDFALTRESMDGGTVLRASGDVNGGGPRLELRSEGGSIRIERQ